MPDHRKRRRRYFSPNPMRARIGKRTGGSDGKTIAYIHGGDPKVEYAMHSLAIIPASGGEAKVLTPNLDRNVVQPHWSPDGKSVFVVLEEDGVQTLVRVSAAKLTR